MAFTASFLGSYAAASTRLNMIQAKRAVRDLRQTLEKVLKMKPRTSNQLSTYLDVILGASAERNRRYRAGSFNVLMTH